MDSNININLTVDGINKVAELEEENKLLKEENERIKGIRDDLQEQNDNLKHEANVNRVPPSKPSEDSWFKLGWLGYLIVAFIAFYVGFGHSEPPIKKIVYKTKVKTVYKDKVKTIIKCVKKPKPEKEWDH